VVLSHETCLNIPYLETGPVSDFLTCGSPVDAVKTFLYGDPIRTGPCAVFSPEDRFNRFREWLESKGGWVNRKIVFHRGYYTESGKSYFSIGRVFLKQGEEILQNEMLFYGTLETCFSEYMIRANLPDFDEFVVADSRRIWMSFGLAALLAHFPHIVGPWAALLPDMSTNPILWPEHHLAQLEGTSPYEILTDLRTSISASCIEKSNHLDTLNITCRQVFEAYAIINSRAFSFTLKNGDIGGGIPFGFDLLNHNPYSKSGIGFINLPPPQKTAAEIQAHPTYITFFLESFVLG